MVHGTSGHGRRPQRVISPTMEVGLEPISISATCSADYCIPLLTIPAVSCSRPTHGLLQELRVVQGAAADEAKALKALLEQREAELGAAATQVRTIVLGEGIGQPGQPGHPEEVRRVPWNSGTLGSLVLACKAVARLLGAR